MDRISQNLKDLHYATTLDFCMSVRHNINELAVTLPVKIPQLAKTPMVLHKFFEDTVSAEKLVGKEIYGPADRPPHMPKAVGAGVPDFHQSKLMHQMAKKLEE